MPFAYLRNTVLQLPEKVISGVSKKLQSYVLLLGLFPTDPNIWKLVS